MIPKAVHEANDVNQPMPTLQDLRLRLFNGEALDVRTFKIDERISSLFSIELTVVSPNPDLDFEGLVGEPAKLDVGGRRAWVGVVRSFELERAEPAALSTYRVQLVPTAWLLTQRRNHRVFQRKTEPDMAIELLEEWKIPFESRIDAANYKKRDYRVQYAESDFSFVSRMLEDAGISYWFETLGEQSIMVLSDSPHTVEPRLPIHFVDDPSTVPPGDFVTALSAAREIRPGKYTVRDVDFRLPPSYQLLTSSADPSRIEQQLESFHYVPGAFLYEGDKQGSPTADDKFAARSNEKEGEELARRRLEAKRSEARSYGFKTNALDLRPGMRVGVLGHPRSEVGVDQPLLLIAISVEGDATGRWAMTCRARRSDVPFRPALSTPKPKVSGIETATVVGAQGDEIHTDEFGRVRVHFHWDRLSRMNDDSSCWVPVSHPWAGTGFGGMNIPRVGQEVIVDFVGGDPDRPMVVGRVYTQLEPVPFKLPDNKTQSGWKTNSTNNTGGYNEIMLEDLAGKELFRMQAEKDLHRLVKNDEEDKVGHDRTREVDHDESVSVGNNRTHQVGRNERITIGQNQSITIGVNRSTQVGVVDSTVIGETWSTSIAPPGEAGPSTSSSIVMTDKKIVLDTGAGATITMEGDRITLSAENIDIFARDHVEVRGQKRGVDVHAPTPGGSANIMTADEFTISSKKISLTSSGDLKIEGKDIQVYGTSTAIFGGVSEVSVIGATATLSGGTTNVVADGDCNVTGGVVQINGPGLFAGRVTDPAPAAILRGSSTVLIGGSQFPFDVVADGDDLKIGKNIKIKNDPNDPTFKAKVLRDLGKIANTPSGKARLDSMDSSSHKTEIHHLNGTKGGGGMTTWYEPGGSTKGTGSDSTIDYNPDYNPPNPKDPNNPKPADANLMHEMGHADHAGHGLVDKTPTNDGWDDNEDKNTINGGPTKEHGPSENDYLKDRGYPWKRKDHADGFEPH